jgi:hypothetical protein
VTTPIFSNCVFIINGRDLSEHGCFGSFACSVEYINLQTKPHLGYISYNFSYISISVFVCLFLLFCCVFLILLRLSLSFCLFQEGVNILAVNYGAPGACPYPRQLKFVSYAIFSCLFTEQGSTSKLFNMYCCHLYSYRLNSRRLSCLHKAIFNNTIFS